jgi:ABC-2 type transport system permease protein
VLAAPVPRGAIVAGKVLGGATLAWLQGAVFLALAPAVGIHLGVASTLAALGVLAVLSVTLTAIGFAFAWALDSVQGYHAVMNVVLVPMWLLSGAFFPLTGAPLWLAALMRLNPMTYGVAALRWVLYGPAASLGEGLPGPGASVIATLAAGAVAFAADLLVTRRGRAA